MFNLWPKSPTITIHQNHIYFEIMTYPMHKSLHSPSSLSLFWFNSAAVCMSIISQTFTQTLWINDLEDFQLNWVQLLHLRVIDISFISFLVLLYFCRLWILFSLSLSKTVCSQEGIFQTCMNIKFSVCYSFWGIVCTLRLC